MDAVRHWLTTDHHWLRVLWMGGFTNLLFIFWAVKKSEDAGDQA